MNENSTDVYVCSLRGHLVWLLLFVEVCSPPPPHGAVAVLVEKSDATISFRVLFCGRRPTGCICHHCFSCHHSPPAPHIPLHSLKDLGPSSPASCSSSSSFSTPLPLLPFPSFYDDSCQLALSSSSTIFTCHSFNRF